MILESMSGRNKSCLNGCLAALIALLCSAQGARAADVPPQVVYEKAWRLVNDSYYNQDYLRTGNWSRWQHRYDGKLKTPDDAHRAIQTMLDSLRNPYTRFLDEAVDEDETERPLIGV